MTDFFSARPIHVLTATCALGLLAGCVGEPGTEEGTVSRLAARGFEIVEDGRWTDGPSALRYDGSSAGVIACSKGGGEFMPANQDTRQVFSGTDVTSKTTTGTVSAYVIIQDNGDASGIYVNTLETQRFRKDGSLRSTSVETAEFGPGTQGKLKNGQTCRPIF